MEELDYGFYRQVVQECSIEFGSVFDLPIVANPYFELLSAYKGGDILDIGAGNDKPLYAIIKDYVKGGQYYSLDNSRSGDFDFRAIDEIPLSTTFSYVSANQVFEHLTLEESVSIAEKLEKHLVNGAKIFVSVPNIAHPNRFWTDVTHKTHWNYNNVALPFKMFNIEITKIARYSKRHPQGLIEKALAKYISRIYRMDWCDSILMIGQKNL